MNKRTLVKKIVPTGVFKKIEPYGHWSEAIVSQARAGFPAKNLKIIGVTGTDGKTTTVSLIAGVLRAAGYKTATMTTVDIDIGDGKGPQPNPTRLTTMGVSDLVKLLTKVRDSGAEWLVLETTSHALAQHRVWSIPYSIAVLTNLNHEHLDYHGTFENYRRAKLRLFEQTNSNKLGLRTGIANADDKSCDIFLNKVAYPISYGVKNGDIRAINVVLSAKGSKYTAVSTSDKYEIVCNLPGSFNVYNSLAAVSVGKALNFSPDIIEKGIASVKSVEGRMTRVELGQKFDVIVDYAHTPESFEKIFTEVKPLAKGRLIAVFGSAGRRDEQKRSKQGEIAGKYCDMVVVTEEDDRDMNGQEILEQIAEGAEKAGKVRNKDLYLVHDRKEAIKFSFQHAKKEDLVLLLGKGHEKSILTNGPMAEELRHLPQDDSDTRRVTKLEYDEVIAAKTAIKELRLDKS